MSGGNDRGTYYAGLGYNRQEGDPVNTFYERYSFITNASYKIADWLTSTSSLNYNRANWKNMPGSNGSELNYFGRVRSLPPTVLFEDEEGNMKLGPGTADGNQMYQPDQWWNDNQSDKFTMSQSFKIEILKYLSLTANMNWYYSETYQESFTKDYENTPGNFVRTRSATAYYNRDFRQTYNAVLNYNETFFLDHHVEVMLGMEYYNKYQRGFEAQGQGAPTDDLPDLSLTDKGEGKRTINSWHEKQRILSFFGRLNYDFKDKFLLSDEFEKAIHDVVYRGDIYLPVEDFFKFENKAMVSATPIVPSDPRFEENGFKILKLVPTYDSRIELTLCTTNNTVAVMRKLLKRLENETVCVFLNSTETILSLIYALRLQGRSRVFCSEKSVRKLKQMNFTDASETLDELAPVNFLTSRFYAAVDIKLDYKPHVILLTDVMRAPFSAVDPQTEVVQAIGRFRNGVARAYHIANTSDNLQCLTREALERRLTGEENIYNQIRQIQPDGEDEAQARFQALNGIAYKRFVTRDGNRNHFMWDNAWTDEQIKAYYRYPSTLTAAYKSAPFRLTVCTAHYPITDADRLRREKAKMNTRELWREVVGQLAKLLSSHSVMSPAFLQEELGNEFAAIVQAFTILGAKRMEELGYSRSKIEAAMTRTEENVLLTAPKMREAVYAQYKTGDLVACSEINNFLHRLIVNNGIPFEGRRVDRKVVKLFFEIEDDTKRLGGQKAFLLGKKMFEF